MIIYTKTKVKKSNYKWRDSIAILTKKDGSEYKVLGFGKKKTLKRIK